MGQTAPQYTGGSPAWSRAGVGMGGGGEYNGGSDALLQVHSNNTIMSKSYVDIYTRNSCNCNILIIFKASNSSVLCIFFKYCI